MKCGRLLRVGAELAALLWNGRNLNARVQLRRRQRGRYEINKHNGPHGEMNGWRICARQKKLETLAQLSAYALLSALPAGVLTCLEHRYLRGIKIAIGEQADVMNSEAHELNKKKQQIKSMSQQVGS